MSDIPILGSSRAGGRRMLEVRLPEPLGDRITITATVPHRGGFLVVHVIVGSAAMLTDDSITIPTRKMLDHDLMNEIRAAVARGRVRS